MAVAAAAGGAILRFCDRWLLWDQRREREKGRMRFGIIRLGRDDGMILTMRKIVSSYAPLSLCSRLRRTAAASGRRKKEPSEEEEERAMDGAFVHNISSMRAAAVHRRKRMAIFSIGKAQQLLFGLPTVAAAQGGVGTKAALMDYSVFVYTVF